MWRCIYGCANLKFRIVVVLSAVSNYPRSPWRAIWCSETSFTAHNDRTSICSHAFNLVFWSTWRNDIFKFCVVQRYLISHIRLICYRYLVFPIQNIRGPHCARIITFHWDVKLIVSLLEDGARTGFSEAFVSFYQSERNMLHIYPRDAVTCHRGTRVLTPLPEGRSHFMIHNVWQVIASYCDVSNMYIP